MTASKAAANVNRLCDDAASQVASETQVPLSILRSITRAETGRPRDGVLVPWPWTVNMEGMGKWFEDEDSAQAYVFRHFKQGARRFNVGCFQVNYKWHGQAFSSIDEMFEPLANARYAAHFLTELYHEVGDWPVAAGAYLARAQNYAARDAARSDRARAAPQGRADTPGRRQARAGSNNFPRLTSHSERIQQGLRLLVGDVQSDTASAAPRAGG